jgi:hypothetical protein
MKEKFSKKEFSKKKKNNNNKIPYDSGDMEWILSLCRHKISSLYYKLKQNMTTNNLMKSEPRIAATVSTEGIVSQC